MGTVSSCVGVILAGGKSSRFGRDKAWASYGGAPFVHRIYQLFTRIFSETYVVLHEDSERFAEMNVLLDFYPTGGPLNGIYSALMTTQAPAVFVAACDLPLLRRKDVEYLLERWEPAWPALVYRHQGMWEPLCGIYNLHLAPALRRSLEEKRYSLQDFLERVGAHGVGYPNGARDSLTNINTPENYKNLISKSNIGRMYELQKL